MNIPVHGPHISPAHATADTPAMKGRKRPAPASGDASATVPEHARKRARPMSRRRADEPGLNTVPGDIIETVLHALDAPHDVAALGASNRRLRSAVAGDAAASQILQPARYLQRFLSLRPLTPAMHVALGRHAALVPLTKILGLQRPQRNRYFMRGFVNGRILHMLRNRSGMPARHTRALYAKLWHDGSAQESAMLRRAFIPHAHHLAPSEFREVMHATRMRTGRKRAQDLGHMAASIGRYDAREQATIVEEMCLLPKPHERARVLAELEPHLAEMPTRLRARVVSRISDVIAFPFGRRYSVLTSGVRLMSHQSAEDHVALLNAIDQLPAEADRATIIRRAARHFSAASHEIREALLLRIFGMHDAERARHTLIPFIARLEHCTPAQKKTIFAFGEQQRVLDSVCVMTRLAHQYPALGADERARIVQIATTDPLPRNRGALLAELGFHARHFTGAEQASLLRFVLALDSDYLRGTALRGFASAVDKLDAQSQDVLIATLATFDSDHQRRSLLTALASRIHLLPAAQRSQIVARCASFAVSERLDSLVSAFVPQLPALEPADRHAVFVYADAVQPATARLQTLAKFLPHAELLQASDRSQLLAAIRPHPAANISHPALHAILDNMNAFPARYFAELHIMG